ncbi:MAG: hypothetical protein ABFE07_29175 [Armatimonadia bacterium]
MLEFATIDVQCYNLDYLVVNWSILPTAEDITLYTFSVWRSESPEGPFAEIRSGLVNVFSHKDPDLALFSKWRKFYYRVRCSLTADAAQYVDSAVESNGTRPDAVDLEIVRRNDEILLTPRYAGVRAYVFLRKTWGQRCTNCWDAVKQRKTESNCPVCFNTGFLGGFYPAVPIYMNFSPSQEMVRHGGFTEQQVDDTYGWLSNYPLVNNKDVIVQDGRLRWRIKGVASTKKLGLVIHQTVQLTRINLNDIEYKLPIPGAE